MNPSIKMNSVVSNMSTNAPQFFLDQNILTKDELLVPLLPTYVPPQILLLGNGLPCHAKKIESKLTKDILKKIKRMIWKEGLYVLKKDFDKIIRYKNSDGNYKNDFDKKVYFEWVQTIENNTALCEMENKYVGRGIFVPPGKKLPKGTFIPSSGIIKLNPTTEELETKIHCSALQDLNSPEKKIVGFIDPQKKGGILNFINHAPDKEELANFVFADPSIKKNVSTSNLRSTIKFYNGYAIMGLEAMDDINGGKYGKQLLWSYARSCEYLANKKFKSNGKKLLLFDNRDKHNGEIIDANAYSFRIIDVFIDAGELILRKVASLTRWELMENPSESGLIITAEDPFSAAKSAPLKSFITHKLLQDHLKRNPMANRVIIEAKILRELR